MQCRQEHGKRIYLQKDIDQIDVDDFNLIQNKIVCANQSINPLNIPEEASEEQIKKFVKYSLEYKAEALWLNDDWWKRMIQKYGLPKDKNVYIDSEKGDFYVIENE